MCITVVSGMIVTVSVISMVILGIAYVRIQQSETKSQSIVSTHI